MPDVPAPFQDLKNVSGLQTEMLSVCRLVFGVRNM